jgi:hypothetical protein
VRALAAVVGVVLSLAAVSAAAWTTPTLLKAWFAASERVSFVEVTKAELEAVAPGLSRKDKYVVYVARTGERVDGYGVVDDEKGQHEPITFGFVVADGRIKSVEVLTYREAYGGEIKDARFLRQLVGKDRSAKLTLGVDVDGITAATISSRSSTVAARRALALSEIAARKSLVQVASGS